MAGLPWQSGGIRAQAHVPSPSVNKTQGWLYIPVKPVIICGNMTQIMFVSIDFNSRQYSLEANKTVITILCGIEYR